MNPAPSAPTFASSQGFNSQPVMTVEIGISARYYIFKSEFSLLVLFAQLQV